MKAQMSNKNGVGVSIEDKVHLRNHLPHWWGF